MTQTDMIIRHLKEFGSITPLEAYSEYGIMRLASRIADIKNMGYDMHAEFVEGTNRFGDKVHFVKYTLKGE